jgi:hypothetical protein
VTSTANQAGAPAVPSPTTADVIVQSLVSHGVDTVFGIPGVQTYLCSMRWGGPGSG